MNARFEQLAQQTGAEFWQRLENDVVNENAYITFDPPESLEKFAELIVRECITTMTNLELDIKQKFPWKKEEVVSTSGHIQKLKEHFGVEE